MNDFRLDGSRSAFVNYMTHQGYPQEQIRHAVGCSSITLDLGDKACISFGCGVNSYCYNLKADASSKAFEEDSVSFQNRNTNFERHLINGTFATSVDGENKHGLILTRPPDCENLQLFLISRNIIVPDLLGQLSMDQWESKDLEIQIDEGKKQILGLQHLRFYFYQLCHEPDEAHYAQELKTLETNPNFELCEEKLINSGSLKYPECDFGYFLTSSDGCHMN